MKSPSRLDTSVLARWWWSVDRVAILIVLAISVVGFVLLLSAGPGAAARYDISAPFHFPMKQFLFFGPALAVMLGVSMLSPLEARRLGTVVFACAFVLMIAVILFADEINGARRWLPVGPLLLQPSELLKPGFVIVSAWMLAEGARNPAFPGMPAAFGLCATCVGALALQPDYGQAALLTTVWALMFFVAGVGLLPLLAVGALGLGILALGYMFSDHVAERIDLFFNPAAGDTYQVDKALEAIARGGLDGRFGDGGSAIKGSIPDAHTDFIFAAAAAEYGFLLCLLIIILFAAFIGRVFVRAMSLKSVFAQTAACGLAALIGLQAFINIAVNLRAMPAKGMTLPFVSYGGSSLVAIALTTGLALAFTRTHGPARRKREIMP